MDVGYPVEAAMVVATTLEALGIPLRITPPLVSVVGIIGHNKMVMVVVVS